MPPDDLQFRSRFRIPMEIFGRIDLQILPLVLDGFSEEFSGHVVHVVHFGRLDPMVDQVTEADPAHGVAQLSDHLGVGFLRDIAILAPNRGQVHDRDPVRNLLGHFTYTKIFNSAQICK